MLASIAATALIIAACWAAGAGLARCFEPRTQLERLSVRFASGLVLVSAGNGLLCLLSTRVAAAFLLALAAAGIAASVRRTRQDPLSPTPAIERRLLGAVAGLALIAGLPPIAAGDSLTYQLPIVRLAVEHHQLRFWPEAWRSTFPQSHEMLAVFVGELGGKRFGWILGFEMAVLAGLVLAVARRWLGDRGRPWLALLIALGGFCPLGIVGDPLKPDILELVALMLGVLALSSALERPRAWTAVLVGIAAGGAAGAKYAALPAAGVLIVLVAFQSRRAAESVLAIAAALAIGGGWYLRNLLIHGAPAPPFGSAQFLSARARELVMATMHTFGRGRSPWTFVTDPVAIFISPRSFGGTGNLFSPLAFLGFGALFIRSLRRIGGVAALAFGALYAAWFFSLQNPRLLFPPVLPLALLAAGVVNHLAARGRRILAAGLAGAAVIAVLPALAAIVVSSARYLQLGEAAFLRARSPFYDDAQRIASELPSGARVLNLADPFAVPGARALSSSPYVQAELSPEELSEPGLVETLRRHHITHVFGLASSFTYPPWAALAPPGHVVWENRQSCDCGRHLFREGPFVETVVLSLFRR